MKNFFGLYRRFLGINLFGTGGEPLPSNQDLPTVINEGKLHIPLNYVEGYVKPLEANLARLIQLVSNQQIPVVVLETLAAAVYQHRPSCSVNVPLRRFLAVASNMYRSFLADEKRNEVGAPLRNLLPPLALFQNEGGMGPFSVTGEDVAQLIGSTINLVSLPATYANDPLLWGIIAHETGGHSVTHADPGLLQELANGLSEVLAGVVRSQGLSLEEMTLLWSYWIDEAAADIYGIMNLGPAFSPNMAALFAAGLARGTPIAPKLRMTSSFASSDPSMILDPHPADILRLHLAVGAIDSLSKLSPAAKQTHCKFINDLSEILSDGDKVVINGKIPISRDHLQQISISMPLAVLQPIAREVGAYIATTKLNTLGGIPIQDIETWDDNDEGQSLIVRDAILAGQSITSLGDDAHLLSGSTMAVLEDPNCYEKMTVSLNDALDQSFAQDPIWGIPEPHPIFSNVRQWLS
jgi:hypothetical protein